MRAALVESLRVNGPTHIDTTQVRFRLGGVIADAGRPRQALEQLREALRVLDAAEPPDEFTLPHVLLGLGTVLREVGRASDSIEVLQRGMAIRDKNRPNTLVAARLREELAKALIDGGRSNDAIPLIARAADIRRSNGERGGDPAMDPLIVTRLYLARDRSDLTTQRQLLGELYAGSARDEALSQSWVDGALLRAQFEIDDKHPESGLMILQQLRAKFLERHLLDRAPLFDGQRLWLCGRVVAAFGAREAARQLFARARSAYGDQLDPPSRFLRMLALSEADLARAGMADEAGSPTRQDAASCS